MEQPVQTDVSTLQELTVIELPCFAQGEGAALRMLGGKDRVVNHLSMGAFLSFSFRISDPLAHPLRAKRELCSGLLLRLRRKRPRTCRNSTVDEGAQAASLTSVEVMGRIAHAYRFDSPADFQFLPTFPDDQSEQTHILEAPPSVFSRAVLGVSHAALFQNTNKQLRSTIKNRSKTIAVRFGESIPSEPHPEPFIRRRRPQYHYVLDSLTTLFKARPLWSTRLLMKIGQLTEEKHMLTECLPKVAFHFTSGPWQRLWCRFGYDPATYTEACLYQQVAVRFRKHELNDWTTLIASALRQAAASFEFACVSPSHTAEVHLDKEMVCVRFRAVTRGKHANLPQIIMFGVKVTRNTECQLSELADEDMLQYVTSIATTTPRCHVKQGWFSVEANDGIRSQVRHVIGARVQHIVKLLGSGDSCRELFEKGAQHLHQEMRKQEHQQTQEQPPQGETPDRLSENTDKLKDSPVFHALQQWSQRYSSSLRTGEWPIVESLPFEDAITKAVTPTTRSQRPTASSSAEVDADVVTSAVDVEPFEVFSDAEIDESDGEEQGSEHDDQDSEGDEDWKDEL